jgi:hypothetical protein
METINVCNIIDVAFVFHANTLEKEYVNCAGMSRVFYTRYQLINGGLSATDHYRYLPFSSIFVQSYPSRLWFFILEVKSKVEKLLHDSKQYQCCRKTVIMSCSHECWNYLHLCMANSNAIFFTFHRKSTEKCIHCDLALSSYTTIKILHVIHIDCEASLKCARRIFGLTFGLGIRNRAPRKGDDPVTMHHGDIVNMIDTTDNNFMNHTMKFIKNQRVDFIYEAAKQEMKIRVNYGRFLAQNQLVLEALRLNDTPLPDRHITQERPNVAFTVVPGTFFMYEGSLVQIIDVNGNNALIRDDETLHEYNIDVMDAATLIRNYLE